MVQGTGVGRQANPGGGAAVTVVVPVWNSGRWLPGCLESLGHQTWRDFSLVLVDNGSTDGAVVSALKQSSLPVTVITFAENRGFAAAANAGIAAASSRYVALLNVDTRAEPGWLAELVPVMEDAPPDVGALASAMVRMDAPDRIDDAGDVFSWYGSAIKRGHGRPVDEFQRREEVFSVCAGAALYRKTFLDHVGGFDEHYTSYLEDVDLCLRGRILGYRYLYVPTARVLHQGHGSGIVGARYVFLMTRNRLMTILKNVPARLLVRHLHQLLYGQLHYLLLYRRPLASIRGYLALLALVPHILRARRTVLGSLSGKGAFPDSLLSSDLGEPSLATILRRRLGW